jgi:aspartyl protease family protein
MLASVLRMVVLWGAMFAAGAYAWQHRETLVAGITDDPRAPPQQAKSPTVVANLLSFRSDRSGHVYVEAEVNGTPIRFLVDTGASLVTLRAEDARAAGIAAGDLRFSQQSATANGVVRMAPVRLRELRLDQLVMEDVDAAVIDAPLNVSLLGLSFLKRLDGYAMRDGALVVSW